MKKIILIVVTILVTSVVWCYAQEAPDSTRLKLYEGYLLQTEQQIAKDSVIIEQIREQLLQLEGARQAFQIIIGDEKNRLEGKKTEEEKK